MACGGVWLVGSRDRGSRWIGDRPAHGAVYIRSRVRLIRTFSLSFSFSVSPHPVGTRSTHRLLQAFCLFASTRSMFPVAQTGESFSMLWCGIVAG